MKRFFVPLPDNESAFFAFVNLVINNRNGWDTFKKLDDITDRPRKIGPVAVSYTRNEVNEPFVEVDSKKDERFVEMIITQFSNALTFMDAIKDEIVYPSSDKYTR